ncbi:MAG TPA: glycosyltransferase family 4 protein [Acidimicrobiia bacterium]|jgi:phosphatidylinositol alpha-1,6-mannosyltransferase|nr:glycosyltransferase family 4 protein [Acidimicrobiia bacterium]
MSSLLVTNDFPPKVGGIQSYLYELWRRLPPADTTVFTTPYAGAAEWDDAQEFDVVRAPEKVLLPRRSLTRRVNALAHDLGARVIFLDPMLPLGLIGPHLEAAPYVVVAHGAEITVPGRIPGTTQLGRRVLHGAAAVVAAGGYPAAEATRTAKRGLPGVLVPPGVDTERFRPIDDATRRATRKQFGLDPARPLVLGLSRLVPRKGFDVVIDAVAQLPHVQLAIGGSGRDRERLGKRAAPYDNITFLGRVDDDDLPRLYGSADIFAMCCRERWAGLEAEGFGIVFLEAAACGVPAVAGRSGGAHEAVVDGKTGYVVEPRAVAAVRDSIARLCDDDELRMQMGKAARERACADFSYDVLVERLAPLARGDLSGLDDLPR